MTALMKILTPIVSSLLFFTPFAVAQIPCSDATTDAAMRSCEIARYRASQNDLAAAIQSLTKKLDAPGLRSFNASQASWLNFRAANATFLSQLAGGSMALLIKETVLADMTDARTTELKRALTP
jgi:uncharacterized protein YecT (DUF1311 family)